MIGFRFRTVNVNVYHYLLQNVNFNVSDRLKAFLCLKTIIKRLTRSWNLNGNGPKRSSPKRLQKNQNS